MVHNVYSKMIHKDTFDGSVQQFLDQIKDEIISNHTKAGQDVTGKTIQSYEVVVGNGKGTLYAAPWVWALDQGRGPTKKAGSSGNETLWATIQQWMADKGINAIPYERKNGTLQDQNSANKSLAYVITKHIHENGTLAFRNGGTGVISDVITDARINDFIEKFTNEYLARATTELLTGFQNIKKVA